MPCPIARLSCARGSPTGSWSRDPRVLLREALLRHESESKDGVDPVNAGALARAVPPAQPLAAAQRAAFADVYEQYAQQAYRYRLPRRGRAAVAAEPMAQTFTAALERVG